MISKRSFRNWRLQFRSFPIAIVTCTHLSILARISEVLTFTHMRMWFKLTALSDACRPTVMLELPVLALVAGLTVLWYTECLSCRFWRQPHVRHVYPGPRPGGAKARAAACYGRPYGVTQPCLRDIIRGAVVTKMTRLLGKLRTQEARQDQQDLTPPLRQGNMLQILDGA